MPHHIHFLRPLMRTRTHTFGGATALALIALLCFAPVLNGQVFDIGRSGIDHLQGARTSANVSIYGLHIGMLWTEGRAMLERQNIPFIFEKGSAPTVYTPPQNSTFYFRLNPSSYEIIEMGIAGTADLPLDNQFLFDGQRWKLTTARTQFFGNEGEFIVNEEGESYNFPYKGVVLKYLSPKGFQFVLVAPTGKPLTTAGMNQKNVPSAAQGTQQAETTDASDARFKMARDLFEAKRYRPALEGFRKIAMETKDKLLRQRSLYWMGESYFALHQHQNAKAMFNKVLAETDQAKLIAACNTMINRINRITRKK